MKRVPIIIVTLNRIDHLKACISSLQENALAKETELFIGLDFPPAPKYEEGYLKIKEYLSKPIEGFQKVTVIEHKENRGVFQNFSDMKELVYQKYDRYIYTEDDNIFSKNYLEYMNACMDQYEKDPNVLAVSGYAYPIKTPNVEGNLYFLDSYFSALGFGMWKDKEKAMKKDMSESHFGELYRDSFFMTKLEKASRNQFCNFVKAMVEYTPDLIQDGKFREVDLAFGIYMLSKGMHMVYPVLSKVRNNGYDGSGVNCSEIRYDEEKKTNHRNYDFSIQPIDENAHFEEVIEDRKMDETELRQKLEQYFEISNREYCRTKWIYRISRVIGRKNTSWVIKSLLR